MERVQTIKEIELKGDIIITDPCYIIKDNTNDWELCQYGKEMQLLGLKNWITNSTLYGDWSCTTYNADTEDPLGQFCADAGLVGVFLLDEVLKYNKDYKKEIDQYAVTLLKDFNGIVKIVKVSYDHKYEEIRVVGKGNINFYTMQVSNKKA